MTSSKKKGNSRDPLYSLRSETSRPTRRRRKEGGGEMAGVSKKKAAEEEGRTMICQLVNYNYNLWKRNRKEAEGGPTKISREERSALRRGKTTKDKGCLEKGKKAPSSTKGEGKWGKKRKCERTNDVTGQETKENYQECKENRGLESEKRVSERNWA